MCLIIHKPAGVTVPRDLIECAWQDNSDGAGIMAHVPDMPAGDRLRVHKILPSDDWVDPVAHVGNIVDELTDYEVGIHFRWRTHGEINHANTHPYELPGGSGYLMHNGVLPVCNDDDPLYSDTFHFIRRRIAPAMADPSISTDDLWTKVGDWTRLSGSTFLIMDAGGSFRRINEPAWKAYKGLMLSNTLSIPETAAARQAAGYDRSWTYYREYDYSWTAAGDGWERHNANPARLRRVIVSLPVAATPRHEDGRSKPLPNKLTRREAKVLRDCLRVGHWGPFARLAK